MSSEDKVNNGDINAQNGEIDKTAKTNDVPEWIKPEIFEDVIKSSIPGFKAITHFDAKRGTAAGENYATIMLRIGAKVELEDGQEKDVSYMLKVAHETELFQMLQQQFDMFKVENGMYTDIVPEMEQMYRDVGCDVKFGANHYELPVSKSHILLEDLSVRGFKNTNRLECLDMDHAKAVLKKLAQWHAASATRVATKGKYPELYSTGFFVEANRAMMEEMNKSLHKSFIAGVKNVKGHENYIEKLEALNEHFTDLFLAAGKSDPEEFNVLNHGDCWSNNIMFQYDDDGKIKETYFVDYQIAKYGTPAQDLLYFILSSTKLEIKLKQFDYFIYYYHQQLIKHLTLLKYPKALPGLKELHKHLYKYGIWALGTVSGVMAAVLCDPSELASMDNFLSDSSDGEAFKKLMYNNERYRAHAEAILPWLHNRGALDC